MVEFTNTEKGSSVADFTYTIIHVNNDRLDKRLAIHRVMSDMGIPFEEFEFCYGKYADLDEWYSKTGVQPHDPSWSLKPGEIGIWQSLASVWNNMQSDVLLFEDDVFLSPNFPVYFQEALNELPEDADFLSLFVPEEQRQDFNYTVRYDDDGNWHPASEADKYIFDIGAKFIARAYHGWGGQALYFTKKGAEKLLHLAQTKRMYTTSDCFLYMEAHSGRINGYTMLPKFWNTVYIDRSTKSIIQEI